MITVRERECVSALFPGGQDVHFVHQHQQLVRKRNIHIDSTQEQILGKCKCESKGKNVFKYVQQPKNSLLREKRLFSRFYHSVDWLDV